VYPNHPDFKEVILPVPPVGFLVICYYLVDDLVYFQVLSIGWGQDALQAPRIPSLCVAHRVAGTLRLAHELGAVA